MLIKYLLVFCLLLTVTFSANASTIYMCGSATECNANSSGWSSGSNSNSCTNKAAPCLNYTGAFAKMASGDTLIIGDGTYSGSDNTLTATKYPPFGSSGAWTTIKAENDFGPVFTVNVKFEPGTGQNVALYWKFEGLTWANAYFYFDYSHHVKVLRCAGYNAGAGNVAQFTAGRGSSYILFEDSHAWGSGRYKFECYQSSYCIMRRCVGRMDVENAGGEPIGIFSMYSVGHGKIQNSIAIDSDSRAYWSNVYNYAGCFNSPTTSAASTDIEVTGSICLNSEMGGNMYESWSTDFNTNNNVFWDTSTLSYWPQHLLSTDGHQFTNNTMGVASTGESYLSAYNSNSITIRDNVFFSISVPVGQNWVGTHTYNSYYSVPTKYALSTGETDSVNPIWDASTNPTGGLKYLPRIEFVSNLSTIGYQSGQVGATILRRIGVSGTLWGDTGYDTEIAENLWPFPNEDKIKENFASYSSGGLSGARGFAANGSGLYGGQITLTSYIWEYLGNECPGGICEAQTLVTISGLVPAINTKFAKTTTQVSVEITTDKAATCRFGGTPGITWGSLNQYDTTGATAHSETLSVVAGGVYQICSRCLDTAAQQYSADSCTSFSVDAKPKSWWWRQ
jgi:hypothetical protein